MIRRSFLRFLGLAPLSAPLAAKAAFEAEVVALTALRGEEAPPLAKDQVSAERHTRSDDDYTETQLKMADYLDLLQKFPPHVEADLRERSRYVSSLDPDIASKRSWSLNVKIMTQRQRNYAMSIERYHSSARYEREQRLFKQLTGFRWGW